MISAVCFDLDGTITESGHGIISTLKYTLEKLGIQKKEEDLSWVIGPPFRTSVGKLLNTEDPKKIEEAVLIYREKYIQDGIYQNKLYPGIKELLKDLSDHYKLFVSTAKPTPQAKIVTEHFEIAKYFQGVYGAELDGTNSSKVELVRKIIQHERIIPKSSVLVGDRAYDIEGANQNGLTSIGALWGYGNEEELTEAKHIIKDTSELRALLLEN